MRPLYRMDRFQAFRCRGCGTAYADPLPSDEELRRYYDQFAFGADLRNLDLYRTPAMAAWLASFGLPPGARLLDVGGGGGFMARVFEESGLGEADYIDLDGAACEFARHALGLERVHQGDVCALPETSTRRYDFIHCRHVLEHLRDPFEMLRRLIALLSDRGVIVLVLPNGASLEYLGYPSMLRGRVDRIVADNPGYSRRRAWRRFLAGDIAHGLDPIRHLWAVTPSGVAAWLSARDDVRVSVSTKPLSHRVYSIYNAVPRRRTRLTRLHTFVVNRTLGRLRGGCHLVVRISRAHPEAGVSTTPAGQPAVAA